MRMVVVRPCRPLGREQRERLSRAVRETLGYHAVRQVTQGRDGEVRRKSLPIGLVKDRGDGERLIKALVLALPGIKFRLDAVTFHDGAVVWSDQAETRKP